jgi:hypothetical protein
LQFLSPRMLAKILSHGQKEAGKISH